MPTPLSSDAPRFRFSAYWGSWSLVLTRRHRVGDDVSRPGSGRTVEIDLSPVNGWARATPEAIARVVALNLRVHCTAPAAGDRMARDLPADVQAELAARLGWDLVAWLLDPATEILGIVNWDKHARFSNGGAPLRPSAFGQYAHLIPEARPSQASADLAEWLRAA